MLLRKGRNFLILDRKNTRQDFHHRDLSAQIGIKAGELHADGTRADHEKALGHRLWHHRFLIGPNQLAIGFEAGQLTRPRAGGDDYVLGGELSDFLAVLGDCQFTAAGEPPVTHDDSDFVFFEEKFYAFGKLPGNLA